MTVIHITQDIRLTDGTVQRVDTEQVSRLPVLTLHAAWDPFGRPEELHDPRELVDRG